MKPTSLTALKRFPFTDYNYHCVTISGYRGRCAKSAPPSFRNISRQYFQKDARRDFVAEALFFAAIVATAAASLFSTASALSEFCRIVGQL